MQWRTMIVLATTGVLINAARSFREPVIVQITWDCRPKVDRISLFRRILTVTKLMTLSGNKPNDPKRTVQPLGALADAKRERDAWRAEHQRITDRDARGRFVRR